MKLPGLVCAAALTLASTPLAADPIGDPPPEEGHEFHFTRGNYGGINGEEWGPRWAVDFPEADEHFLVALKRLTGVDASDAHNAVALEDPRLRDFPFLYMVEVGSLALSDAQADALRDYLRSGGFLMVDDFWGSWAWQNFETQMRKVFPDRGFEEVPLEHPLFHAFYDIEDIIQVPNVHQAYGPTHEYDGKVPHVRGIFDERGRLMVVANWNTDLGDAWEWADNPDYPLRYSTYAFEVGINFVVYAMSH